MAHHDAIVELDCPAKINLFLAILGRRPDGFHDLLSVAAQAVFGDRLRMEWRRDGRPELDQLVLEQGEIPGDDNSVIQAMRLFRAAAGWGDGSLTARLWKRIPVGAGLGGGSSDAVAAIRCMAALAGPRAEGIGLAALAARIGSDCPLFLADRPVVMRGRGEIIQPVDDSAAAGLRGRPVILFKPQFPINTAEAYRRLAAAACYTPAAAAARMLDPWTAGRLPMPPRHNDFERLVMDWLPSLAVVLQRLRERHGMDARLSGSGSACFVFPAHGPSVRQTVEEELETAWGRHYWLVETIIK